MVYVAQILETAGGYEVSILEQRIAFLRDKLQRLYTERGGTDEDVLAVSVELDEALNEYEKLKNK
ncbi:Spo0E like sporulation regulatory protein [Hydrogenispora ethanolica]|jgi:hypothetical protein|uniref:Spo0E like sporulation regulatory protein n=1 Tax=Hydrogenispora ethanolica TaxID=1082276 RepID=A0A4R1R8M3_HYDET|nr:aspartyl-phosphate phosphatase Spo0E family protein [Hydrogenispora ethanolica]TCL62011.1 Spo0E like sporulation regulatory protein [Hydrogenispora ethanolica]